MTTSSTSPTTLGSYNKFTASLVATVLVAIAPAVGDGHWSGAEIVNTVLTLFGAVAVLGATNLPAGAWRYAKTIAAVGTAVMLVVSSAITDGQFSPDEIIQCVIAGLNALGVVPWLNNSGSAPNGASTIGTGLPAPFAGPVADAA